jgi:ketosteroid isomerase-like protein
VARPNAVEQAVLASNAAFYAAFEAGDLAGIEAVWERTERAVCTHPGWGTLRGWDAILSSFTAILRGGTPGQFIVTSAEVDVAGDVAWVTCDENLWSSGAVGTVAALNVLVRDPIDDAWRFVAHHGSAVHAHPPEG